AFRSHTIHAAKRATTTAVATRRRLHMAAHHSTKWGVIARVACVAGLHYQSGATAPQSQITDVIPRRMPARSCAAYYHHDRLQGTRPQSVDVGCDCNSCGGHGHGHHREDYSVFREILTSGLAKQSLERRRHWLCSCVPTYATRVPS